MSTPKQLDNNHSGVGHWKWQRRSALVLIPLTLWVVFSLIHNIGADYATAHRWVANPAVAFFLIIFIVTLFYHAKLGLQVVIEDYIADFSARHSLLLISNFVCWLAIVVGVCSVLKIAISIF